MPKYQMIFDTNAGEVHAKVQIDEDEPLRDVLPELLSQLEEDNGVALKGWREGVGEPACTLDGRELDQALPLPQQRVSPNDVLRIGIRRPPLQIRRDNKVHDVEYRVELHEGDDIIVGRTILRFHIKNQQRALNKNHTFIQRLEQGRSFQQNAYQMALVGGIAGIACWFLFSLVNLSDLAPTALTFDLTIFALLGALIGGLMVGFGDYWLGGSVVARWALVGAMLGAISGGLGGLTGFFVKSSLQERNNGELLGDLIGWLIAGTLIGLAISLRWVESNKNRLLHGLFGGMFGGLIGGLAYRLMPLLIADVEIAQALGLILTGAGITLGISLAPILLRQGVLEFINSRDPMTMKKYAQSRKQWEIHEGGKYIIGSLTAAHTSTVFAPELSIFIPDQMVALRHAIVLARDRHYYLEPHPELRNRSAR